MTSSMTSSITPQNQHIAIFGCGQLAQMTAQAGIALGLRFSFIAEAGEDTRCVDHLGTVFYLSPSMDAQQLYQDLGQPDVITVEKEMVDAALMDALSQLTLVSPNSQGVYLSQNRVREKNFLRSLSIPTADFAIIHAQADLVSAADRFGFPLYIKAAESGYDGYNQWRIRSTEELKQEALSDAIEQGVELIAEKHVPYQREVSVIAARNAEGEIVAYPMMENRHEDGVLIATIAPAPQPLKHEAAAINMIRSILVELDYVGVLTMECFETDDGIIVNELAPRVHNSGHWTIEGAETSQFENHCRAIAGLPLGSTVAKGLAGIVNILGHHGDRQAIEAIDSAAVFYHAYGKEERKRRKLGHVTVCDNNLVALKEKLNSAMASLYGEKYHPL